MMASKIKNLRFSREIRPTPPILFGWRRGGWRGETVRDLFLVCYLLIGSVPFAAHAQELPPTTDKQKALAVPTPPAAPAGQQPLPINLPTALQLANAQAIDVAVIKWFETNVPALQHTTFCSHGSQYAMRPLSAASGAPPRKFNCMI